MFEADENIFEVGWGDVDDGFDVVVNGNLAYYPRAKGYSKNVKVLTSLYDEDDKTYSLIGSLEIPIKHSYIKHDETTWSITFK